MIAKNGGTNLASRTSEKIWSESKDRFAIIDKPFPTYPKMELKENLLASNMSTPFLIKINTSNDEKYEQFKELFATLGDNNYILDRTSVDLDEILASPLEVVQNKATEVGENILVDDTSLDVEGGSVGVEVRWVMEQIDQYIGKKATLRVLLGIRKEEVIHIYEGVVHGTLVPAQGERKGKFGIDPYFLPDHSIHTLAQIKEIGRNTVSPRYLVVKNYCEGKVKYVKPLLRSVDWPGRWQSQ